jgi:hypothetical protein
MVVLPPRERFRFAWSQLKTIVGADLQAAEGRPEGLPLRMQ